MFRQSVTTALSFLGALILVAVLALPATATEPPPTPEAPAKQVIYDTAGLLNAGTIRTVTLVGDRIAEVTGMPLVVHAQHADDPGPDATQQRAEALLADDPGNGVVVLVEQHPSGSPAEISYAVSPTFEDLVPAETLDRILTDSVRPVLGAGDLNAATIVAVARLLMELSGELPGGPAPDPGAPADAPPPGPPFPDPEMDRAVYDFAGVFEPETIASVEEMIDRIEERTKAEVVVYTQVVDFPTTEETERHARALIDQWGVGRAGFDDGLAIFFDFEPGRSSGQVQLYAAPGFAATFLTNSERQQIFENDMLPHLRGDDWDAAILAAMDRIDEVATPENAARLERGRQLNAVVGLMGAPLILAGLVGWAVLPLAPLRQGPGLSRLAVDLRAGPATRPHGRLRRDGHRRRAVTPRPDHRDARPGESWPHRVPRGERDPRARPQGRHRPRPRVGRRDRRGPASAQQSQAHGPGRAARAPPAADRSGRATTSNPTTCSSSGRPSTTSMPRSRSTSSGRAGSPRRRARPSTAGSCEACWRSSAVRDCCSWPSRSR